MQTATDRYPWPVVRTSSIALAALAFFASWMALLWWVRTPPFGRAAPQVSSLKLEDIPFDGARAYQYLKQLCEIGPRPSGSEGMRRQQQLLDTHFRKLGATVDYQRFQAPDPRDRRPVSMANMLIQWRPQATERILLAAHYDTLPLPMRDPKNPQGRFVGANDNASGVALLMELGNEMSKFDCALGVDFLLLDGEEYVFDEDQRYFIGSEFFARQYAEHPPAYRYRWGVLLDMVGDRDLEVYEEGNSVSWRDTRPLVDEIWGVARSLQVREFIPRVKHQILDDHLMLRELGKFPTCDVIDFDYPSWHTQADMPDKCSALSLAKVGWVLRTWLSETGKKR